MAIHDIRQNEHSSLNADVCIIGSGPAGLSIAAQFIGTNIKICVLESGGLSPDPADERLSAFESVGVQRVEGTRRRAFGGTSWAWTGQCGVMDEIDYQARPWVPFSGWPISSDDVAPYLERAGRLLGLGPVVTERNWREVIRRAGDLNTWDHQLLQAALFQFSRESQESSEGARTFALKKVEGGNNLGSLQHAGAPQAVNFGTMYRQEFERSENIKVLLHANATEIHTSENSKKVRSVTVRSTTGSTLTVNSKVVVLAAGGIDNARLLLASRSNSPCGLGNARGMVGRFLADHPMALAAVYNGEGSREFRRQLGHRWLDAGGNRHLYQCGLRINPELQRREELLNCAFHLVEYGETIPSVVRAGRFLRSLKNEGFTSQTSVDLFELARDPVGLLKGGYDRYVARQPTLSKPDTVAVCCVVEQQLDADSRVLLSDVQDELGMPQARIDWRVADADFHTAKRATQILIAEMRRVGLPLPELQPWLSEGPDEFRAQVHDMAHPMCSTRMSGDPSTGTVDLNCQVHGVDGLYVAGSSTFSTPGYMNPTLMIVALSLRLSDHIKNIHFNTGRKPVDPSPALTKTTHPRRARVGFIGAGDRVLRVYLPVLQAMTDEFELVGFTCRTPEKSSLFGHATALTSFPDARSLISQGRPDFVVVAVSTEAVDTVFPQIINLGCPLLLETPICWSVAKGRKLLKRIDKMNAKIGVAEQTPFLPNEQIKRKLIELGLLGRILSAYNDFAVFDYHGIAALRAYVTACGRAVRANGLRISHTSSRDVRDNERWMMGMVSLEDGTILKHHYSAEYDASPLRRAKFLRVCGTSGSIVNSELAVEDGTAEGKVRNVERDNLNGRLQRLTVETPIGIVQWQNPFAAYEFTDEQIAVASHLRAMANMSQHGGLPLYSARQALEDMEILSSLRMSADKKGRPLEIPIGLTSLAFNVLRRRIETKLFSKSRQLAP